MKRPALRVLGWAVHIAFFAAWVHVALMMEGQMHDGPPVGAATVAAGHGGG